MAGDAAEGEAEGKSSHGKDTRVSHSPVGWIAQVRSEIYSDTQRVGGEEEEEVGEEEEAPL